MSKKILRFSADWCQPCKILARNIDLANLNVPIETIDIDENSELSAKFKIRGVPTLVMVENDLEIKRTSGVKTVDDLKNWVNV